MSATGRSGVTHCGSWTRRVPRCVYQSRIVCNLPTGHDGRHRNRDNYAWTGDETPRYRKPEETTA